MTPRRTLPRYALLGVVLAVAVLAATAPGATASATSAASTGSASASDSSASTTAEAPPAPTNLRFDNILKNPPAVGLTWNNALTDAQGENIDTFAFTMNGKTIVDELHPFPSTTHSDWVHFDEFDLTVEPNQSYPLQLQAVDSLGQRSEPATIIYETTPPSKVTVSAGPNAGDVQWTSATDNVGIAQIRYFVVTEKGRSFGSTFLSSGQAGSINVPNEHFSHTDTFMEPGEKFTVTVTAVDTSFNSTPSDPFTGRA
jgi:hypothetical protein